MRTSLAPLICATAADETYSESELSRRQTPPDKIFKLIVVFICGFCLLGYTGGICVFPNTEVLGAVDLWWLNIEQHGESV